MNALILWDYVCCFRAALVTPWGNVSFRACLFHCRANLTHRIYHVKRGFKS